MAKFPARRIESYGIDLAMRSRGSYNVHPSGILAAIQGSRISIAGKYSDRSPYELNVKKPLADLPVPPKNDAVNLYSPTGISSRPSCATSPSRLSRLTHRFSPIRLTSAYGALVVISLTPAASVNDSSLPSTIDFPFEKTSTSPATEMSAY